MKQDELVVEAGRRYRHAKGGVYRVVGEATHTETKEALVVYVAGADGSLWARPRTMFVDGRFTLLSENDEPAALRAPAVVTSEDREALRALAEQLQTQHNDYTVAQWTPVTATTSWSATQRAAILVATTRSTFSTRSAPAIPKSGG